MYSYVKSQSVFMLMVIVFRMAYSPTLKSCMYRLSGTAVLVVKSAEYPTVVTASTSSGKSSVKMRSKDTGVLMFSRSSHRSIAMRRLRRALGLMRAGPAT